MRNEMGCSLCLGSLDHRMQCDLDVALELTAKPAWGRSAHHRQPKPRMDQKYRAADTTSGPENKAGGVGRRGKARDREERS